ncbi:MAG: protein translocase subunit SecD [Planctomycetaceae bacterium]|jgi:SecD/SecF fusion protein|nr:protein translocase subunit SecD [Planctomycetaceae bacterium]
MNRISFPRILNFIAVALILGLFYILSLPNNTAQETAVPAVPVPATPTETVTPPIPATSPIPPTESPAAPVLVPAPATPPTVNTAEQAAEQSAKQSAESQPPSQSPAEQAPESTQSTPSTPANSDSAPITFPVVEQDPNAPPASFADVPETAAKTPEEIKPSEETGQQQDSTPFTQTSTFSWMVFLVLVAGCFFAGQYFAKLWRLPEHNIKIFVVLLAFLGSLTAVVLGWHRLTLGIDLQGGVVLIYDAIPIRTSEEAGGAGKTSQSSDLDMDKLARAITKRINPGGVREISITKLGTRQIQVVIPRAEDAEVARIERVISESGSLTFRILASKLYEKDKDIIARGEKEPGRDIRDSTGKLLARWVPVVDSEKSKFTNNPDIIIRQRKEQWEVLVLFNDGVDITGEALTHIGKGMSEQNEQGVTFSFNSSGASKFKRLTSANRPDPAQARLKRQLGIILNDQLYSAPNIEKVISDHGIITFGRRETDEERVKLNEEIEDLIDILTAGALPADLSKEPVSRLLIGATLGADTIQKGKIALVISAVAIMIFMIFYYHLAGLIACFCVITNTALLVAIMLALHAAFTLPGLAGLVLTIGMAVDANILIYERLREELLAGASLRMAIRNGYAKAFSAIFDSNITTIAIGIILFMVGTEQVKGFAVTLVLGIALNMFTAIYCARVIMDVFEAQRWIKTFHMLQLFRRPNINFLGTRFFCAAFSVILIIIGIAGVIARGRGILDIDFIGGVSIEVVYKESQNIEQIRTGLYEKDKTITGKENRLNDLAVQNVQMNLNSEQDKKTQENTHFIVTTSIPQLPDGKEVKPEQYLVTVRNILKETFGDALVYCQLDYTFGETVKVGEREETTIQLNMFPIINHDALRSMLSAAIQKMVAAKELENDFAFSVSREDFMEGSQQSYSDWTVKAQAPKEILEKIFGSLKSETDGTPYFPTSTTVGGSVAYDTRVAGLAAIITSLIFIIIYIWFRFHRLVYGLVAAIGLFHDVLVVLGLIALSAWLANPLSFLQVEEFKIGLPVVAAFLTIIGYSINDTIILFDRIRENIGKSPTLTGKMINKAINQTLSRTILTSLTTFIVSIILYFWGGQGIHTFAFTISLGVLFGTYSTIGLCAPLLYWMVCSDRETNENDSEKEFQKER